MSDKYFIDKAKEQLINTEKETNAIVKDMLNDLKELSVDIEKELNAFYQKYGVNSNINSQISNKMISNEENNLLKYSIKEYFNNASEDGSESLTYIELNNIGIKNKITREEKLLADIYLCMAELAYDYEMTLSEELENLLEFNYEIACQNLQEGTGTSFAIGKIDRNELKAIIAYPWTKKTFSKTIWDNIDSMAAHTKRVITKGFASGASIQRMTRELQGITGKEKYVVERLVRTECKYFANQGELLSYKNNGIKKYVFMGGTEGSINCECEFYNNKVIDIDKAEVGHNFPPLHPNCKCTIRAYFENSILNNNDKTVMLDEDKENNLMNDDDNDIIKETNIIKLKEKLNMQGVLNLNPKPLNIEYFSFDDNHINKERLHNVNLKEVLSFMNNAKYSLSKWNGKFLNYYSLEGAVFIDIENKNIRTAFKNNQFDDKTKQLMEEFEKYE